MAIEFKAEIIDGVAVVKAVIERDGNNVKVHVPALHLIEKLTNDLENK
jgi:hypothetical protein